MLDLFEQVNFLENFSLAEVILHIIFLNSFDSDLFSCELMDSESYFTKSTFSNEFNEFVEVQCCWRQLVILLDILFYVLYQLVSLLEDCVIDFCGWLRRW
jgi:hypothetical protein